MHRKRMTNTRELPLQNHRLGIVRLLEEMRKFIPFKLVLFIYDNNDLIFVIRTNRNRNVVEPLICRTVHKRPEIAYLQLLFRLL